MERKLIEDKARIIVDTAFLKDGVVEKMQALERFDRTTFIHSLNVAYICVQIALLKELDSNLIDEIALGGVLHDVGKLHVPANILFKKGCLTADEFSIVKTHPELGIRECKNLDLPQTALDMILHHNERVDGSGYPHGLSANELSLPVRIINTVDSYDAMTSKRAYKKAYSRHTSLRLLDVDEGYTKIILELLGQCEAI